MLKGDTLIYDFLCFVHSSSLFATVHVLAGLLAGIKGSQYVQI